MKKLKVISDKIFNTMDKLPFHPTLIFYLSSTIIIAIGFLVAQIALFLINFIVGNVSINDFLDLEFQHFLIIIFVSILISLGFGLFVSAIYILMNAKLFFYRHKRPKKRKVNKHMEITNKRKKKKKRKRRK